TVPYQTGQILWGNTGTNSQHSFHQLFHQGTHLCNIDFLLPLTSHYKLGHQHRYLVSNCLAQSQTLMKGKSEKEAMQELINQGLDKEEAARLAPHKAVPGNKPSTLICYDKMTPKVLGQLIALYEHKVYVQSVIWDINAFDQWGVESGKQLCDSIEPYLQSDNPKTLTDLDASTAQIINRYHQLQKKS
ncbi:MAG: glucose-6-phosphate isomerase, partial [Pseudomonadales bacterium]|nr:glucose-6-phosphate isomerase [Pseudomonadales bacterium]